MIKAVIFDLDNTLYDERLYFFKVFDEFSRLHNIDNLIFRDVFSEQFILDSRDIFTDILKEVGFYSKSKQNQLFEIYKKIDCQLGLYQESYSLIDYLNENDLSVAIVTNGVLEAQMNKVKVLGVNKIVDTIIYARKFGKDFEKPNKKPFLEALKLLNVNGDEAIFVGDHPNTDILGARNAGIKALRFMNGYASAIQFEHEYNIYNLFDVKEYLGS